MTEQIVNCFIIYKHNFLKLQLCLVNQVQQLCLVDRELENLTTDLFF